VAAHFLAPLLDGDGPWGFVIAGTDRWLATYIEPAFESSTRTKGLLGRDSLPDGHALVIAPCQAVHTFGMRFPIDVVGVKRDGTVVRCRPDVPARRLALALRAWAIVELPAGTIARSGLRVGDRLATTGRNQNQ
jgi:uncharacterized membrane protein (UPF0127 family)